MGGLSWGWSVIVGSAVTVTLYTAEDVQKHGWIQNTPRSTSRQQCIAQARLCCVHKMYAAQYLLVMRIFQFDAQITFIS